MLQIGERGRWGMCVGRNEETLLIQIRGLRNRGVVNCRYTPRACNQMTYFFYQKKKIFISLKK